MMKTHNVKTLLRAGALLAVAVTWGNLAQAQTCTATWTGNAGDGRWFTAGNWSPPKVPGSSSDVCITGFGTAGGTGSTPISVHSIQVTDFASVSFEAQKVLVATSFISSGFVTLYGTTLSAASIDITTPYGNITAYDNSTITSPAFSNTNYITVGTTGTLRLTDNPVQLQNGNLSGGTWYVDGVLILPSDISQISSQGTILSVNGYGSVVQDASGRNALATLTSVGPGAILQVVEQAALTVDQSLTCQGSIAVGDTFGTVGNSLTVNGTYTVASGGGTGIAGTLSATSVLVQAGSSLGGGGTVESSITNNGTVSTGNLTVTGNYIQAAAATLSQNFAGGTLHVNGNATVSGALNVVVSPKRPPRSGQFYTALTASSLSGSFTRHTSGFTVTTNGNSIVVTKQ